MEINETNTMKPSKVVKKAIDAVRRAGWIVGDDGVLHAGRQPLDIPLPFDYYGLYLNEEFVMVVYESGAKIEWKNEREIILIDPEA